MSFPRRHSLASILALTLTSASHFGCSKDDASSNPAGEGGDGNPSGSTGGSENGSGGAASGSGGAGASANGTGGSGVTALPGTPDENVGQGATPSGFATCATAGTIASQAAVWSSIDQNGPDSHNAMYGARPRLIAAPRGDGSFDVAWQTSEGADKLFVSHVEQGQDGYAAVWHLEAASLGQIGGLAIAPDGDVILITASDESLGSSETPAATHRDNIMQAVRIGSDCMEKYRVQLRTDFDGNMGTLPIYSPFTAGTSRLAVSDTSYVVHYSQNTEFDAGVNSRHQIGRYLVGNLSTGALTAVQGNISHSFSQRLHFDGQNFVSLSLGDASLRGIAVSLTDSSGKKTQRTLYTIKGGDSETGGGYNNTYTRLGDIAAAKSGYVAVFATEDGNVTSERVNVSRNLAWTHIKPSFQTIEEPEKYSVVVTDTKSQNASAVDWDITINDYWGNSATGKNREIVWLSDYADRETAHVERPKLVRYSDQTFYVVWEKWTLQSYDSTWAMLVDEYGNILRSPKSLGTARIGRGDDAFLLSGTAAWLEGRDDIIVLHQVDTDLKHTETVL